MVNDSTTSDGKESINCCKKIKSICRLTKKGATPTDWPVIILVFTAIFGSAYSITYIFPYVPDMILHFGYAEEDKGYYAGLIASAIFVGRCFGSYFWGWLADRFGRKPVLLICLFTLSLSNLGFGLVTSFPMAFIVRLLNGISNGVIGTCKTILYEVCDDSNQAIGISTLSFGWGLGIVVGPLLSGYLSEPAKNYLETFGDIPFFTKFPFVLPSVMATVISALSLVLVGFRLPETLASKKAVTIEVNADESQTNAEELDRIDKPLTKSDSFVPGSIDNIDFIDEEEEWTFVSRANSIGDSLDIIQDEPYKRKMKSVESLDSKLEAGQLEETQEEKSCCAGCRKNAICQLLKEPEIRMSMALYAIFSFAVIGWEDVFIIWASTARRLDGLGLSAKDIGKVLGFSSIGILLLNTILFPKMERHLGAKRSFQYMCIYVIFFSTMVATIRAVTDYMALMILLMITSALKSLANSVCFSSVILFTNNSAKKSEAGRVNGLSMTLTALARSAGPSLGGSLFAWSITHGKKIGFPFDVNIVFFIFGAVYVASNIICVFMPESLNKQKKK